MVDTPTWTYPKSAGGGSPAHESSVLPGAKGMPLTRPFADTDSMVTALQPSYPVYCLRPRALAANARRFIDGFPGEVMYAVKCNPHPAVLDHLYEAGIRHFDTASLTEIATVREAHPEAEAYFMHPVKSRASLLTAAQVYDVRHYVIDHVDELAKIAEATGRKDISVLVRLSTPGEKVLIELSRKFGAPAVQAVELLRAVHAAGFPTGVAFHVGSQCSDPGAYRTAMNAAAAVIREAGVPIRYLDVGGGFPASYANQDVPPMEAFFEVIRDTLKTMPVGEDCVVMCEPGRALVADACSLVVQVQLRKDDALYINDGIFHSLSEANDAGLRFPARMIRPNGGIARETQAFTIYGPTCDSNDLLPHTIELPVDIGEGDWIEFGQVGAYSNAMTTRFNGFHPETFVTVDSLPFTGG